MCSPCRFTYASDAFCSSLPRGGNHRVCILDLAAERVGLPNQADQTFDPPPDSHALFIRASHSNDTIDWGLSTPPQSTTRIKGPSAAARCDVTRADRIPFLQYTATWRTFPPLRCLRRDCTARVTRLSARSHIFGRSNDPGMGNGTCKMSRPNRARSRPRSAPVRASTMSILFVFLPLGKIT